MRKSQLKFLSPTCFFIYLFLGPALRSSQRFLPPPIRRLLFQMSTNTPPHRSMPAPPAESAPVGLHTRHGPPSSPDAHYDLASSTAASEPVAPGAAARTAAVGGNPSARMHKTQLGQQAYEYDESGGGTAGAEADTTPMYHLASSPLYAAASYTASSNSNGPQRKRAGALANLVTETSVDDTTGDMDPARQR